MATATAPPAADPVEEEPTGPAPTAPAAATGPLARILTPVEPARTAPPLGSTASMGQPSEDTGSTKTTTKDAAGQNSSREGAVSALVRALATRLARTGTTTKVQRTHDVKETRVAGSTSTATSANKAERHAKHDQQHRSNRDAKTADLDNKASQRQARTNADTKKADTTDRKASNRGTKDTKTSDAKGSGASGGRGKPDSAPGGTAAPKPAPGTPSAPAKDKDGAVPQGTAGPKPGAAAQPGTTPPAAKPDPKGLNAKTNPAKPTSAAPSAPSAPTGPAKTTAPAAPAAPAKQPAGPAPTASRPGTPAPRTKAAREAGYRDGGRAAAVTGQVRAYRDGAVDGWDDRTAADRAEAEKMDKTRASNALQPDKKGPPMAPASGSTVDLTKNPAPAQPVKVTSVGEKNIAFIAPDGAAHIMSRGEVRTLKGFERRLADQRVMMGRVAEGSKVTRKLAVDMATRAQSLAEGAKAVKGGQGLVRALYRMAERAQALRLRAEQVEGNAHRGAEAVKVLAANANTRHGGIYRAVVDSPLTKPAEREFYLDKPGG